MSEKVFISTTGHSIARAQCLDGKWITESLLIGEPVRCLAHDPHNNHVVFAGTQNNGIFRSADCGKTWNHTGMAGYAVKSIAASSVQPGLLFVGTKPPAVFKSSDSGATWEELKSFGLMQRWFWHTPAEAGAPYVLGLATSPTESNVVVAGIEYGATLRSNDSGKTWQGHMKGAIRDCHSMKFHATNGNYAYAGGGDGPGAISRDGGRSWQKMGKGTRWSRYGFACAADPQDPEIWYISAAPYSVPPQLNMFPRMHWDGHSNSFIFRADGDRWKRLGGGLPQPLKFAPYSLITDPKEAGHLYAGLSNGEVWRSTNYGDHWTKLPFKLESIYWQMVML